MRLYIQVEPSTKYPSYKVALRQNSGRLQIPTADEIGRKLLNIFLGYAYGWDYKNQTCIGVKSFSESDLDAFFRAIRDPKGGGKAMTFHSKGSLDRVSEQDIARSLSYLTRECVLEDDLSRMFEHFVCICLWSLENLPWMVTKDASIFEDILKRIRATDIEVSLVSENEMPVW